MLYEVLERHEPSSLQHAAFAAIAGFDNPAVGRELVLRWRRLPPSLRPLVLRQLLRVQAFHGDLLDALESGAITLGELNLDLEQRRRLMRLSTPAIHRRAAALIGDEEYGNRAEIVLEVLAELPATGSKEDGRQTFESVCAQCHRHGGLGNAVGPDLESVSHRSAEDLVSNILDPDMAINPAFTAYRAELASGRSIRPSRPIAPSSPRVA